MKSPLYHQWREGESLQPVFKSRIRYLAMQVIFTQVILPVLPGIKKEAYPKR